MALFGAQIKTSLNTPGSISSQITKSCPWTVYPWTIACDLQEKTAGEAQVVRQEVKSKEEQVENYIVKQGYIDIEAGWTGGGWGRHCGAWELDESENFLVVGNEVELLVAADEEEQDSEK